MSRETERSRSAQPLMLCPNWDRDSWISWPEYVEKVASYICSLLELTSDSRILDLGCGRGRITSTIARQLNVATPVEGIDPASIIAHAVDSAQVSFKQIDALTYLSVVDASSYDAIIFKQTYHCISSDERPALLEHVFRCLKPSGTCLIMIMPYELTCPMFRRAEEVFFEEQLSIDSIIVEASRAGLGTAVHQFSYPVSISKRNYLSLIESRFMSHLRLLSDRELREGLAELDRFLKSDTVMFEDRLECLICRKLA
ncbi:MAG: class I SAM-dependent methyltransferase [Bdellovibrionales bacterium]|nr:class I SAM-dependent methyltransferase [Bdellovibrionales bacterium]